MKCNSCGAQIDNGALSCTYCGAPTALGHQQHDRAAKNAAYKEALDAHQEHHQQRHRFNEADAQLKRTSEWSLYWSLGGLVMCCAIVPSIVGIVLGIRARKLAHAHQLVLPTKATVGLILGLVGVLSGASVLIFATLDAQARDERVGEIKRKLGGQLSGPDLSHAAACLLVEKSLLEGDFRDNKSIDDIECPGKLRFEKPPSTEEPLRAVLEDVQFEYSADKITARACLELGQTWHVRGFRLDVPCSEPDDTKEETSPPSKKP